jgi:uncharacterized protein YdeI (YjbR/CyaY-like superfamily)
MQTSFRGVLQADGTALRWVIVHIPFDPAEVWPVRTRLRVKGTVNGFPFRTSLFGTPDGGYILMVNRKVQKGGRAYAGTVAEIVIEPDMEERSASAPSELTKLFRSERSVGKWYEQLNYSMRKYIADSIAEPKSSEARKRRAEQWMERMMLAMEGEREIPPILQAAFRRQPQARMGWDALTPIQRRNHLLGIFYCQSPEARLKRADKAAADALRVARKDAPARNRNNLED